MIHYHGPVVVFDLDDTLFRERDFCRSGFNFLCSRYGEEGEALAKAMDEELTARRNPFVPYEKFLKSKEEGDSFDLDSDIARYRSHEPVRLPMADGVEETVKELSDRGVIMAVITDGRSVTQRNKIKALGLDRYVPAENVWISEETGRDKHSPDSFVEVVRKYPEARSFFYVGDNELKDFHQANLLGWTTVKVPYHSDNVHPDTNESDPIKKATVEIRDFKDILKIIF